MKKLLVILMVIGITIPALAVDISLVDNGDCTGTIQYTAAAGEVIRGLAIVVGVDAGEIVAVTGVNPEFNVFMDAAYTEELGDGYTIGEGTPVADPAGAGEIALPASIISLCMGKVDELGGQTGAPDNGTYDVATIELSEGATVTITADTLRGGIVGDAIVAGTINDGVITCPGCETCMGDQSGDSAISLSDVTAIIGLIKDYQATGYLVSPVPEGYDCSDVSGDGAVSLTDVTAIIGYIKDYQATGYLAPCNPAW